MRRVVVVGGGIGGLATAIRLRDRAAEMGGGVEVVVVEASGRPGGNIRTDRVEGFTIERGPNGYLDNVPATRAFVRRLGLEAQIQKADASAARRFLYRKGRLHLLPSGPVGFLKSPVLSPLGRLRVLGEPFARPKPPDTDESVYAFAARRIGAEAAAVLVDAMVSGVFAGDVRRLSLASSFPRMAAMEEEHGSLVKAMLARMKERRSARREAEQRKARGEDVEELTQPGGPAGPGGTLTSFREGLETLPSAAARELDEALRLRAEVVAVEEREGVGGVAPAEEGSESGATGRPSRWRLRLSSGEPLEADAVVMAIPASRAAPLVEPVDRGLSRALSGIRSAGLAVVALAYDAAAMGGAPQGFGFLIPRGEGPRILGCLWDSSIFPGRAPEGKVLLRAMIGGAHDPEAVGLEERELVEIVRRDLAATMGLSVEPLFVRVYRWPLGIAQYRLGHRERLDQIHAALKDHPGLWVAGSSYYGISMNACIEKAEEQAEEVLAFLRERK